MEREAFKKKFDAADTTFYKTWVENVVSECLICFKVVSCPMVLL